MKAWQQPLALIAIAGAMALGGCGGGSSSTAKTTAAPAATTGAAPDGTRHDRHRHLHRAGETQKAVAECHNLIEKDKSLPSNAKAKLENACDEAGKGDTDAVQQVAREVCEEVVTKSPLPADSPARKQALETCKKRAGEAERRAHAPASGGRMRRPTGRHMCRPGGGRMRPPLPHRAPQLAPRDPFQVRHHRRVEGVAFDVPARFRRRRVVVGVFGFLVDQRQVSGRDA